MYRRSVKKHKSKKRTRDETSTVEVDKNDVASHGNVFESFQRKKMLPASVFLGGWWAVKKFNQITGSVAFEFSNRCYIKALDNGLFVLGPPHDEGIVCLSIFLFI